MVFLMIFAEWIRRLADQANGQAVLAAGCGLTIGWEGIGGLICAVVVVYQLHLDFEF